MAAKKRRSRGLAGSPKHHAQQAILSYENVLQTRTKYGIPDYDDAMASGSCMKAFRAVVAKERAFGDATLHAKEYWEASTSEKTEKGAISKKQKLALEALQRYESEFASKCLVGQGLDGLGRAPRRRRR